MGYDHPCMSFVYSYVFFLVVLLALCIGCWCCFGFLVDWVRLCFEFLC